MTPRRPVFAPGNFYHLYNRGAHRQSIFHSDENYLFALKRIKEAVREYSLTLIAYCLLPNHYHFLVRQDRDTRAGILPQSVFNSYSKAYNKRFQHSGTLFEGPYKALLIEERGHLLHLCRYIHANPIKHGFTFQIEEWPYSNFLEWVGERNGTLVDRVFVRDCFGTVDAYRRFVIDYLISRQHPVDLKEQFENLDQWY